LFAADACARAANELFGTAPPFVFAVAACILLAAALVILFPFDIKLFFVVKNIESQNYDGGK
jgi:hypothetical protein